MMLRAEFPSVLRSIQPSECFEFPAMSQRSFTKQFSDQGFELRAGVVAAEALDSLRDECTRLQTDHGKASVRHVAERSAIIADFAKPILAACHEETDFRLVRSLLFDKRPGENWPVLWHQDLTIQVAEKVDVDGFGPWSVKDEKVHVEPPLAVLENMLTLRVHLDDTSADNGALEVIPGSHRQGKWKREQIDELTASEGQACPCKAGDVLMMSPLILHASRRAIHPRHRRVLHFEYAPQDVLPEPLQWA